MLNPVAPHEYLHLYGYFSVADITNPDWLVCGCRTWTSLDIAHVYVHRVYDVLLGYYVDCLFIQLK